MMAASVRRLYLIISLLCLLHSAKSMEPWEKLEDSKEKLDELEQMIDTFKASYVSQHGSIAKEVSRNVCCMKAMKQSGTWPAAQMDSLEDMTMTTKGKVENAYEDGMTVIQEIEQRIAEFREAIKFAELMVSMNGYHLEM